MNCTLRAVGDCDALLGDTLSFTSVEYAAWTRISSKRLRMSLTALEMSSLGSGTAVASTTVNHFHNELISFSSCVTTN